jgi:hypothetical protein
MSQRFASFIATIVALVVGALATGEPGRFRANFGPEDLIAIGTLLFGVVAAINSRVSNGTLRPGDVLGLLGVREFWVAVVGAAVLGFNLNLPQGTQDALITVLQEIVPALLTGIGVLSASYAQRPATKAH